MKKSMIKKVVSMAAIVMTAGIFAGCSTAKTTTKEIKQPEIPLRSG